MNEQNLLTLWSSPIPPDNIPTYPTYELERAKGGETNWFTADEIKVSESRSRIIVGERIAEPGELLRDTSLRYMADWSKNLEYRARKKINTATNPSAQTAEKAYCKSSILYFANTYCWAYDPRRSEHRRTPFVTFPFQDDALTWAVWLIKNARSGAEFKSREMGASWMAVIVGVWLCLFYDIMEALFMSMREEDVDDKTIDSLLGKVRFLLSGLPEWMRCGWVEGGNMDNSMKINFPETKSNIKGILSRGTAGRSGRATVCFPDEFAFVEDSTAVLAALSELSNTKIYLSTANGMGNEFARMVQDPSTNMKEFHWTLHPLKNEESQRLKRNEPDMTEEIWASEQEMQLEVSTVGRVFPQFLSFQSDDLPWVHIQEGPFVQYEAAYDTYTSTDLGVSDPCSTLFMQIKPAPPELAVFGRYCYVFFQEHEARNMTALDLRYYINSHGYHYREHVVDIRTGEARDSGDRTWIKNLGDSELKPSLSKFYRGVITPGPPIVTVGRRSREKKTIENFRMLLNTPGAVVFSKHGCPNAIMAMQNWSFPKDKDSGLPKDDVSPNHGRWSHSCKAALYLVDWLAGKGDNRPREAQWDYPALRLNIR